MTKAQKEIDTLAARQRDLWQQIKEPIKGNTPEEIAAEEHRTAKLLDEWNGIGVQIKGLVEQARAAG